MILAMEEIMAKVGLELKLGLPSQRASLRLNGQSRGESHRWQRIGELEA